MVRIAMNRADTKLKSTKAYFIKYEQNLSSVLKL